MYVCCSEYIFFPLSSCKTFVSIDLKQLDYCVLIYFYLLYFRIAELHGLVNV